MCTGGLDLWTVALMMNGIGHIALAFLRRTSLLKFK